MKRGSLRGVFLAIVVLAAPGTAGAESERVRLATTTSTENSGLLGVLLPPFERASGIDVQVIAVGSGKALKLGENGDVDLVLSHAPVLEAAFLAAGYGVNPRSVMYNDFVLVGPPSDPAAIRGAADAVGAFGRITEAGATFVSRGDESGTHQMEKSIWEATGRAPSGDWYLSSGRGMGEVLLMANEKQAYALADRGTFLAYRARGDLEILFQGDPLLRNPYTVMVVNPARHGDVAYVDAMRLLAWMTSPEGQRIIGDFRVGGEPLFRPTAVPLAEDADRTGD